MIGKTVDTEIAGIFKDAYKDLGYDINIIFSDPKNSPQLKDEDGNPKTGTAYVDDYGVKTIIINAQDPKNTTKAGLIGTIVEEGSHVIGKVEGKQRETGTGEKGLESTGRASNEYFAQKYKDDNPNISIKSDGKDYSNVDFGENVGNIAVADDVLITIAGVTIAYIAGAYIVQQNGKTIGSYPDLKTAQKNVQYLLNKAGDGLKWIWNGGVWIVEQGGRIFAKSGKQVKPGEIIDTPDTNPGAFKDGSRKGEKIHKKDGSSWTRDTAGHQRERDANGKPKGHAEEKERGWKRYPNPKNKTESEKRTIGKNGKVLR